MIRILIVDDHAIVRRGLKQIIADEADMTVVGEAGNAEEMLAFVWTQTCDVVVTDICMPGRNGLDALKELIPEHPTLPVLVLSMYPEDQYAARALELGAAGYLSKDRAPEELVKAIRKVVTGGKYVNSTLAKQPPFDVVIKTERPVHERLSKLEHEILCLIATGKSRTEIAADLALSVPTIANYRVRILQKMAMRRTAELMYYAIRNRLVS